VCLEDVRRIFAAIDQAKSNVRAAATGYHGTLRIALSDAFVPSRLASLLARCRVEEPEVKIGAEWLNRSGYHADIPALRKLLPTLNSFDTWLREVGAAKFNELLSHQ
jgi:DNA-binding transcriptional LysR family regulator